MFISICVYDTCVSSCCSCANLQLGCVQTPLTCDYYLIFWDEAWLSGLQCEQSTEIIQTGVLINVSVGAGLRGQFTCAGLNAVSEIYKTTKDGAKTKSEVEEGKFQLR